MTPPADDMPPDTWVSPLAALPGAVLIDSDTDETAPLKAPSEEADSEETAKQAPAPLDVPVALHYSDPAGEQWALEAGRALVDRNDLRVVTVAGADRQTWLTSLTSQVITGMQPGVSRELLIMNPQGHIEHAAAVLDDGQVTYLVTEGSSAPALAAWLDSMRFALRVTVGLAENLWVCASMGDSGLAEMPEVLMTWDDPWPGIVEGGAAYFQGKHPAEGMRAHLHLVRRDDADRLWQTWVNDQPQRRAAGLAAWEAVRIAAWRPRLGYDTDSRTIAAEVDWLRTAVHTNKGCYRGQESIARVINLGRPPRRLVFLHLDGSRGDLPRRGDAIERGGRRVGIITSVARHADMGPIALALVSRALPADEVLNLDGIAAAQEVIVPLSGKSSLSPENRPGADLVNPQLRRPDVPAAGALGARGTVK